MNKEYERLSRERGATLGNLLNALGLVNKGVEIGVYRGAHTDHLLKYWKGKQLVATDWWQTQFINSGQKKTSQRRLLPYVKEGRCVLLDLESGQASTLFEDYSLDFVYMDAAHDYESATRDILLWTDKIKPGGLLIGHDFIDKDDIHSICGVKSAVFDYIKPMRGVQLYEMNGHHERPEFIIAAPNPIILEYAEPCRIPRRNRPRQFPYRQ